MAVSVLEALWLQPGALSALQVVVEIIAVVDTVPDPHAVTATWEDRQRMYILTTGCFARLLVEGKQLCVSAKVQIAGNPNKYNK